MFAAPATIRRPKRAFESSSDREADVEGRLAGEALCLSRPRLARLALWRSSAQRLAPTI